MAERIKSLNLLLLGKIGVGKSASGNTILGRQAFESKKSFGSVTKCLNVDSGLVCGLPVTVYDTPGLFNTKQTEEEVKQKYEALLQECDSDLSVFLLVIKADRFTKHDRETVEKIEKLLGQNRLEKTWILFTRGDELEEEYMTIQEFINDTEQLKTLVQKYEQRYHVFNNMTRGDTEQVKLLIAKILNRVHDTMVKALRPNLLSSLSPRRIVLLGKTGVGKSAATNTILGQKVFRSVISLESVTSVCSEAQATVSGRSVSVVDTPGFSHTQMKLEELVTEIIRSVYLSSPGAHAFLIVFTVNMRFTEEEQQIPQIIELMFGQEVLKYSIILFTHGDQLEGETIEEIIVRNSGLKDLVQKCGGRFHVFSNKAVNNRDQVNELLQKIDSMIEQNGGGHYSYQMFEDAQRFRREEEEGRRREERSEQREEERRKLLEEIDRLKMNEREERMREERETGSDFQRFFNRFVRAHIRAVRNLTTPVAVAIRAAVGGANVAENTRRRQRMEEERKYLKELERKLENLELESNTD